MIIVAGRLYVRPEARDEYLAGCRTVIEQARAAPGCLDFAVSADPIEAGRINVYEQWKSQESLQAFRGSGPEQEQVAAIVDASVAEYRVAAVEAL